MKKIVNLVCDTMRLVLEMSTMAALRALGEGGAESIDAIDAANLKVFVTKESAATSGVVVFRKAENAMKAHTFAIDGTTIDVNVGALEEGVTRIGVIVQYGTNMRSAVLFNVTRPVEASEGTTTKQYDIEADKSFGGGSVDFETDVYMDGDGRIILERLGNGSTTLLDMHENPILKRMHNGSTQFFDAYQSVPVLIGEHGDISVNAGVYGKHVNVADAEASAVLDAGVLAVFASRTSDLSLSLNSVDGHVGEYHMIIAVAGTPTITWPAGVTWAGGEAPTLESGKTYEVSILNNVAVILEYEAV